MKKELIKFIEKEPIIFGIIALLIALVITFFNLKKESKSFSEHSIFSWKVFINSWAIVVMLLAFALISFFK